MRKEFAMMILLGSIMTTFNLSIEPNHDKPCIVGDAWAEECMSCVCVEGRIASCRPTLCASRLRRALDHCREGEITRLDCNTCVCRNNRRLCTKQKCSKNEGPAEEVQQRQRQRQKKREKFGGKVKGGFAQKLDRKG